MGLPAPDELKNKARISYGLMVVIFGAGVYLGGVLVNVLGLDRHFTEELYGLRSDMNREIQLLEDKLEATNARIDRKIENHNNNKRAHK